jgi:hypothetical protein
MKRYILKQGERLSFLLNVNGKNKSILFSGFTSTSPAFFQTGDLEVCSALEQMSFFDRYFTLVSDSAGADDGDGDGAGGADGADGGADDTTVKEYAEVTGYQGAMLVLRGAPYNLQFKGFPLKEELLAQAAAVGVSFPNYS